MLRVPGLGVPGVLEMIEFERGVELRGVEVSR